MENSDANRELLGNIPDVGDVGGSQFMIQRMAVENTQLLSSELLQQHNGLVVDLGAGDFIPVNYPSEDLLPQDLTEEDRNLAAALVAVQLSQQQKQQMHNEPNVIINTSLPSLVSNTGIDTAKVSLNDQELILAEKAALNSGYLQIVSGTDSLYVDKQMLPKLIDTRFSAEQDSYRHEPDIQIIRADEDSLNLRDSDGENKCDNRSSKKSLPHKKRISRKLKKSCPASRKVNKCNLCEEIFNTPEEFSQHQTLCQTIITPIHTSLFSCQLCNASFQDQLKFFEHLKTHYEPRLLSKPMIPEAAVTVEKIIPKLEQDNSQKDTLLASLLNNLHCMQCGKTFRRQKAYEAHVRDAHNKIELNEFSEPEDLMEGIDVAGANVHHSDDESKTWYREEELHATEADLKELEAQDRVCHICNKTFTERTQLLEHLASCRQNQAQVPTQNATHNKKRSRKKNEDLHCTECERVFTHRNSLIYHMRSHSGVRPHQCDQCGKSFFAASALKVHLRLHSGDKPYRCDDCGRSFRQWGDLRYHCVSLHSDEKQYQCEYCGKHFARKYSLIVHRRIHTGEKNYKCEFCEKTFRASSYLQNHRRIHTGEKPHTCEICGKPFRVRSDMKRHLKTHGRKKTVTRSCNDLIITKVEDNESNEASSDRVQTKEEGTVTETLQYETDPLDEVRDGNTLYTTAGHQLFICYPEIPVRSVVETAASTCVSTWIQTD